MDKFILSLLALLIVVGLVGTGYMTYDYLHGEVKIVDCYDKIGNVIIGLECTQEPMTLSSLIGFEVLFLIAVGLCILVGYLI